MNRTMLVELFNKRELLKENTIKHFVLIEFGLERNHKRDLEARLCYKATYYIIPHLIQSTL